MATILVVEDHPAFAQSVARLLHERNHYDVEILRTGEDALEHLQDRDVDVVLIDISLPGRNGVWLARALHGLKPSLPCVILSGYANKVYVDQALEAGARGYVLKEDIQGLLAAIREALTGGVYISEALRPE